MVDWSDVTLEFDRLVSLDDAEIERELKAITDRSPETADLLRKQIHKQHLASGFMATRAPEMIDQRGSLSQGDQLGPWEVEELIGSGGMGSVYRARRDDGVYDQTVAIKQLHGGDPAQLARFNAERKRLAQLEHPHIARIIDGGTDDAGRPYMAMEFVEGEPINLWADRTSASREMRLRLLCQLADALAHAHARLVLHRDVKAANVLVNDDGQVRLIDFGIATLIDEGDEAGIAPLTLAIAAPEQLVGSQVSVATDIFMVGMLAHLLLTGNLPRRNADGSVAVDGQAINNPDLNAIVTKALATKQDDRYNSIDAFGDDLEKYLGGFEVAARPLTGVARFNKLLARNKLASAMGSAAIAAAVAGAIGVAVFAVDANREAEAARIAQQRGANTIEFYETLNAGFIDFVASIDPQSSAGNAMFGAIADLENLAQELESSDPQKALETYIFLAEIYADAGQDLNASRIGEKLAAQSSELSYPSAFTLSSLVHPSEGIVETDILLTRLDRLNDFFKREPVVHSFDIAHNRCVRARLTRASSDERTCLDLATRHLASSDADNYAVAASNLTLSGYAMESARSLRRLEEAKKIAADALSFYRRDDRPTTVPEANFWIALSDISQIEKDWRASLAQLRSASRALETSEPAPFLEIAVEMEFAQTHFALANYTAAQASAQTAADKAAQVYGADHYQVRDAQSEIARAIAKQGNVESARRILDDVINAEALSDNDPAAIKRYGEMLASIESE